MKLRGALFVLLLASLRSETVIPAGPPVVTAPLVLQDGIISQPKQTELAEGGKAIFPITVPAAGDYVVRALVDAPEQDANSFYLNIDAPPEDPVMVWDILRMTEGFQERTVSWRGDGDANYDQFSPKIFTLSAGEHWIIVVGREPARLKSLSLVPYHRPAVPAKDTPADFERRYEEANLAYDREVRKLQDTPEGRKAAEARWRQVDEEQAALFLEAVRFAEAHPRSPAGFQVLEWVLLKPRSYYVAAGSPAIRLAKEQYAQEPGISTLLRPLINYFPQPESPAYADGIALIEAVSATNPDRLARGRAMLWVAARAKERFQTAEWNGEPVALAQATAEVEKILETVVRDYGDCPSYRPTGDDPPAKTTLGQEAGKELHEIRRLSLGKIAPEITGADIDGAPLKLSDYRGKVVLLVFWAGWCGPCMADVPHEKELVERFKGRPFVLLGVSGDSRQRDAAAVVKKNQIPWRSFWHPDGPHGPIPEEWNVHGWPTVYVLDHEGVIRQKYLRGSYLDEPLEKLVSAAEKKAAVAANTR